MASLVHDIQVLIDIRSDPGGSLSQFTDTVVISHICPIRISIGFLFDFHGLRTVQKRSKQADGRSCIRRRTCRKNTNISTTVLSFILFCKERVTGIQARGRELEHFISGASVQRMALLFCSTDGCSRGNNFGMDFIRRSSGGTKLMNQRFIMAHHRSQGSGNQMQLILNNQIRRGFLLSIFKAEDTLCLRSEWQHRKLIHRSEQQSRGFLVNILVNDIQR